MSAAAEEEDKVLCAFCGVAGGDDIKLMKCNGCFLVRYCGAKCQKEHWSQHKNECKKRAAELKDEILFKQPESSYYGDCPICCLPLPIEPELSTMMSCCSKQICDGCNYANKMREYEGRRQPKCPFCRSVMPITDGEINQYLAKRIEANDPAAMCHMAGVTCNKGDYRGALEYWKKAAALGDALSHYQLSTFYYTGEGGVEKDKKKHMHHLEQAAIGGHPHARRNLGCMEETNGRMDRAAKHYIIAAKLGFDRSLENVKLLYKRVYVSKEDFAAALRGYKAAIDAIKSPQREEAAAFEKLGLGI